MSKLMVAKAHVQHFLNDLKICPYVAHVCVCGRGATFEADWHFLPPIWHILSFICLSERAASLCMLWCIMNCHLGISRICCIFIFFFRWYIIKKVSRAQEVGSLFDLNGDRNLRLEPRNTWRKVNSCKSTTRTELVL